MMQATYNVKCSVAGCANLATRRVEWTDEQSFVTRNRWVYLCDDHFPPRAVCGGQSGESRGSEARMRAKKETEGAGEGVGEGVGEGKEKTGAAAGVYGSPVGAEGKEGAGKEQGEGGKEQGKPEDGGKEQGAENAKPEGGAEKPEPGEVTTKLPLGDMSRWKDMDSDSQAYEIKDRGVIVRTWNATVFIPGTKLVPDVNNGFRIVAG